MCNEKPFWAKKNRDKWLQLRFNIDFLKKAEIEYGGLHCEYCGKKNLIVYEWCEKTNKDDVATVDHFYPKSKYENFRMEEKNFVISCHDCNNKKKDDIWSVEKIKFPLNKERINNLIYID